MSKSEYDRKYFEELYGTKIPFYKKYLSKKNVLVEKALKRHVGKGRLLDVGCGDGSLMRFFSKDFEVYGIDISGYIIDSIKNRDGNARVEVCDIEKDAVPFKQEFDVIFMWNIVEHLHDPEAVLKKITENLTEEGMLVLHLPTKNNILSRFEYWLVWDMLFRDPTHIYIKPIKEVNKMIQDAGYEIIDYYSGQFIPFFLTKNPLILNSACQYLVFLKKKKG